MLKELDGVVSFQKLPRLLHPIAIQPNQVRIKPRHGIRILGREEIAKK
jgi:hypothetical protein